MPPATPPRPTAFVAGATGFCGRFVVQALRASGCATTAHVRPDSPVRATWVSRFGQWGAEIDTTPWQTQDIAARLQQLAPRLVFCLLGTTQKRGQQEGLQKPYEAVDVTLSCMLIDAAASCNVPPLFVYLSCAGASARAPGAYMAARWQVEEHLRRSKLAHLIARPGLFSGERDQPRISERVFAGVLPPVAWVLRALGAQKVAAQLQPMTGQQLGQALVQGALAHGGGGRILEAPALQASFKGG